MLSVKLDGIVLVNTDIVAVEYWNWSVAIMYAAHDGLAGLVETYCKCRDIWTN